MMMIMNRQLTNTAIIANAYKSSEATGYPVANAYNLDRRLKRWRSGGYRKVVSGQNVIIFRETAATDLVAVVAPGTYTTDASFFAAILSALSIQGSSAYTIARSATTNRIVITSDGAGGGGIFELNFTDVLFSAAMAEMLGFDDSADRTGALTYEADYIFNHQEEWLKWDFGFPVNPTGLILADDRNGFLNLSPNAVVKLQGNPTDEWTSPLVDISLTYADNAIVHLNKDGIYSGNAQGLRYWRVYFQDKQNPDGYIEFGIVHLAQNLTLSRGCAVFPFSTSFSDRTEIQFSEAGQTLVVRRPKAQGFILQFQGLDKASLESLEATWNYYGLHSSFLIAMDTDGALGTDFKTWTRVVKFADSPNASLVSPGNWSMEWNLREEI